jgi:hypothetical protein
LLVAEFLIAVEDSEIDPRTVFEKPRMPFQPIPPDVVLPGFEMAAATLPCHGETVNGDGLFVETGRTDGAYLLLLVDVMGHGPRTVVTMNSLRNSLRDPIYGNRQPAELLMRLHGVLEAEFLLSYHFAAALALLAVPAWARCSHGADWKLPYNGYNPMMFPKACAGLLQRVTGTTINA